MGRERAAAAVVGAAVAAILALALTDPHLDGATTVLTVSTAAAAVAAVLIAVQPLLARGPIRRHQALGLVVFALVALHVALLFVESPSDALFAMSPDGPTRARMALIATIALVGVVALGLARTRLRLRPVTWRIWHAYLATVVILLGFGHALLTDGALDGIGTPLLLALAAIALAGVLRSRAARPRGRARARSGA